MDDPIVCGAVFESIAASGYDLECKLVPRFVVCDAVANPLVITPHLVIGKVVTRYQQEIGPFIGPIINEIWPLDKVVDKAISLIRCRIVEEFIHLGWSRQDPSRIKICPADKF